MQLHPGMRALVTGASSGIGAALAERLAARGVDVGIVARRTDRLQEVLDRCLAAGAAGSRMWTVDLHDLDAAVALAEEAWTDFGPLDVIVHNAGRPMRRHISALTATELDDTMRLNFHSPVRMTMALLPPLLDRDTGSVVFVSSLAGRLGVPREAAYTASKFALCGWAESMHIDLADSGVEVRLVLPGAIDTEIWDTEGNDPPVYTGQLEPVDTVADAIVAAVESDRFEHYLPDMSGVAAFKVADPDAYLAGAADMARTAAAGGPPPSLDPSVVGREGAQP